MNAIDLYNRMEDDFRLSICHDDWDEMTITEYITEQYSKRYMGLVTDNTNVINHVYTAVFPSQGVIGKIIADDRRGVLLFVHHPMQWDMRKIPVFTDISIEALRELQRRQVSIYNLHVPLDANGIYGTTWNFAKALNIEIIDEFYEYGGVKVGIIGTVDCETVAELQQRFENAVDHKTNLYPYGKHIINNHKIALIAGGGNEADVYPVLCDLGINTFLTGIGNMRNGYQPSIDAHNAAKKAGVNILTGTH